MIPALEARGLAKRLGSRGVLAGVDLLLHKGTITGLVGPNGAGKTTLIRILSGQLRQDRGDVLFDGEVISPRVALWRRARAGLGLLPQSPSVFHHLSVWENLIAVPGASARRCEETLRVVGLEARAAAGAESLSGGERRRLEIGRLLLLEPRILLCDEPFAGLDPMGVTSVSELLREIASESVAVLVTGHTLEAVFELSEEVAVLLDGTIACRASPDALRNNPLVRRRYLGESGTR